jgi:hypothetical protein
MGSKGFEGQATEAVVLPADKDVADLKGLGSHIDRELAEITHLVNRMAAGELRELTSGTFSAVATAAAKEEAEKAIVSILAKDLFDPTIRVISSIAPPRSISGMFGLNAAKRLRSLLTELGSGPRRGKLKGPQSGHDPIDYIQTYLAYLELVDGGMTAAAARKEVRALPFCGASSDEALKYQLKRTRRDMRRCDGDDDDHFEVMEQNLGSVVSELRKLKRKLQVLVT